MWCFKRIAGIMLSVMLLLGNVESVLASDYTDSETASVTETVESSTDGQMNEQTNAQTSEQNTGGDAGLSEKPSDNGGESSEMQDMTDATDSQENQEETSVKNELDQDLDQNVNQSDSSPKLSYRVHIQGIGWNDWTENNGTIGTTGQAKRLEAIELKVDNGKSSIEGSIEYRVHVQSYGWSDRWFKDGETAGTSGEGKRLEAIQIRLTGTLSEQYDIYYRTHVQSYGWLNWSKNGEKAGSLGYGKRMEALEICLIPKGTEGPDSGGDSYKYPMLSYQVHVQSTGWQQEKFDGETAGTIGQSKRLEAVKIKLPDSAYEGEIEYQTYRQSEGWPADDSWTSDGQQSGTTGQGLRLEAIRIRLTGEMKEHYDVYYRVYVQSFGWLGWAKNGENAGTRDYARRLEAMEIKLVEKGNNAPDQNGDSFRCPKVSYQVHSQSIGWQQLRADNEIAGQVGNGKRMEAIQIKLPDLEYTGGVKYRAYIQSIGWQQGWKQDGQTAGITKQAKRIEAIQIALYGEAAEFYDIYYSVHMAKIGWTNYTKGGEDQSAVAGSTDLSKRIEAVRIQLVRKGDPVPDTSGIKFIEGYKASDVSYSGTIQGKGQSGAVQMGGVLGTCGQSRRLENIKVVLNRRTDAMPSGTINYAVHLSGKGWTGWSTAGNVSGCTDGSRGIEAVMLKLTGDMSKYYDIYYRAYVQKYGWLGWAKNGQAAGTTKCSYRLEALQIKLVSKDAQAPGANSGYYTETRLESGPDLAMYARANMYSSTTPYIIMVDRANRRVGIYQGWRGAWRNIKYWSCTVGAPATQTVTGVFKVGSRGYYFDSGNVRCFWWTQFYGDYLFHSTTYYPSGAVADGRLGMALSHGCVRLNINNAKWIYDTIPSGTTVVVYN